MKLTFDLSNLLQRFSIITHTVEIAEITHEFLIVRWWVNSLSTTRVIVLAPKVSFMSQMAWGKKDRFRHKVENFFKGRRHKQNTCPVNKCFYNNSVNNSSW